MLLRVVLELTQNWKIAKSSFKDITEISYGHNTDITENFLIYKLRKEFFPFRIVHY